jgi:hypothetical protein
MKARNFVFDFIPKELLYIKFHQNMSCCATHAMYVGWQHDKTAGIEGLMS